MTVVVAAVPGMLEEPTRVWAAEHDARVEWLTPGDGSAYYRLFAAEWAAPGDLLIVEHDMLPAPGVTDAMLDCRRPWCVSPYQIANGHWLTEGLGCTKFGERVKTRYPSLAGILGGMSEGGVPARDWHRMDVRVARLMNDLGYRPHQHRRSQHLHDYTKRP